MQWPGLQVASQIARVTSLVCNLQCNKKLHCRLQEKFNWLQLFAMLRDKLQRLTPLLATCVAIFAYTSRVEETD